MQRIDTQRILRNQYSGLWALICFGLSGCAQTPQADPAATGTDLTTSPPSAAAPTLSVAANDPSTRAPLDATPSPDGSRIYYLALAQDASGQPSAGVFAVDAEGSTQIETLTLGQPLLTPIGIASSLDGRTLYIADAASGEDAAGALYRLAASGGTPELIDGTEGYRPGGVVVGERMGQEVLYFSGREPDSAQAGVFRVSSGGGQTHTLAQLGEDSQPSGVAMSQAGELYVCDYAAGSGRVLQVTDAGVQSFVDGLGLGFPAGIALTHDDSTLLISGLDPETKHDVVYTVDTATREQSRLTDGIAGFRESAGLHRAHEVDVFAWADSRANGTGTVYTVKF